MNKRVVLTILILVSLIPTAPVEAEAQGSISFQPSEMPNLSFDYNVAEYRFELTWKTFYLNLEPFAVYKGQSRDLKEIIPWIKNQYPNVDYRWAVDKFKNYHRWGYWLENLPQNVADNLDYLGFRLDYNFPLSAVEIEWVEAINHTFPRIQLGNVITLDFLDLYEHGFTLEANKTHLMIGNVKGKTDLDLDPVTYSSPIITVLGTNGGSPWTFWDIWNASNINGWGVVHNNQNNNTQYQIDCKLTIGDGGTITTFKDQEVQIFFFNVSQASSDRILWIKGKATVTFGHLRSTSLKITSEGVQFIVYAETSNIFYADINSTVYFYSCSFSHLSSRLDIEGYIDRVWNCVTDSLFEGNINTDFHNVINQLQFSNPQGCTFTDTAIISNNKAFFCSVASNASNLYVRTTHPQLVVMWSVDNGHSYFVDVDTNTWLVSWEDGVSTKYLYRQYTFNILVVDGEGIPILGADVSLKYSGQGGGTVGSWETPANGLIPEQTITKGFYNHTGDTTIYSYEPYNLTVSALGYDSESFIFNISEPTTWTIGLMESVTEVEINVGMELMLFAGLGVLATLGAFLASPILGAVAGGLGLFLWSFTAQWFMIQQAGASTTTFGYVFYMLAVFSLLLAVKNILQIYNEMSSKGDYK